MHDSLFEDADDPGAAEAQGIDPAAADAGAADPAAADAGARDPIVTGLNPVQREAVLYPDGPLLVLAGAGSGKTRILTRRIVHLITRRDIPPDRILAVTFTNKAAGEMRTRVESMLGWSANGLWIGTFHSICLRLLRRHADRLGFDRGIAVFDTDDSASLLKEILKERNADAEAPKLRDLQSIISSAKNRFWSPDDLEREWPRPERHRLAALYREYQERLLAQGAADFDDLLLLAVRLLEEFPDVGDSYARKFLHLLVDEYQDTNHVQFRLVRRLAQGHGNVMVVGDDDQSIYGWRGADITNILEFEKHFPRAKALRMTQNYRSTGAILEVAGAVVRNNRSRREKTLWTENPNGERPRLLIAEDEEEEARRVIHSITKGVKDGRFRYSDVAILYRVHAQSRPLEEACMLTGAPYQIVGGTAFYQRREVKDLLAYVRLALNPWDEVSFVRALAAPARGIGEVGLRRILNASQARGGDLIRTCRELTAESGLKGKALQKGVEFGELLHGLTGNLELGPEPILREICDRTNYLQWLKESGDRAWEERQGNVIELLEGAARFQEALSGVVLTEEDEKAPNPVQAYLDQVALYTNLDQRQPGPNEPARERITLMTVHNAKGLEFPHVFITGLEDGLFPHYSSLTEPAQLEEERRLFYVAATRAMNTLCLTASMERRRVNRLGSGGLSRFVEEIPADLLTGADPSALLSRSRSSWSGGGSGGYSGGYTNRPYPAYPGRGTARPSDRAPSRAGGAGKAWTDDSEDDPRRYEDVPPKPAAAATSAPRKSRPSESWKGRNVIHAVFGVGRVEAQEGDGPEARLLIVFPQVGKKKIVARFVRPM